MEKPRERMEHRREACKIACPLDSKGKCAEHGIIRWILALLVTIGLVVVSFTWRTHEVVGEGIHDMQKMIGIVSYAQEKNMEMMREIRNKPSPPIEFKERVDRIEGRIQRLESIGKP